MPLRTGGIITLSELSFPGRVFFPNSCYALPSYSYLKKNIYQLEKRAQNPSNSFYRDQQDIEANEHSALIENHDHSVSTDGLFRPLLDSQLQKIVDFYAGTEKELLHEVDELEELVRVKEEENLSGTDPRLVDGHDDDDDDDDIDHPYKPRSRDGSRKRSTSRRRPNKPPTTTPSARELRQDLYELCD